MDGIQEFRHKGLGLAVRERNEDHDFRKAINDSQGFGFAGEGETLALKIHSVAGSRFIRHARRKETVR